MKLDTPTSHGSTPKKDVIYVDIEDDITSIIGKVKESSAPIVALVPPKRIGVLQSIVNLKLLTRAAEGSKKRVVLITNDHALSALAAGVAIPVAKNLQSKPEIPEIPALHVDDEDVIEGEATSSQAEPSVAEADTKKPTPSVVPVNNPSTQEKLTSASATTRGKSTRVPNFDMFRNRMALIVGGGLLIIGFFVWAVFFAPHATVIISAKTTPYSVNKQVRAGAGRQLDAEKGILSAVTKEIKKTTSADFTATGKKDVGEKATGTATFSTASPDVFADGATIPSGTTLTTSGGSTYTTNETVTLPQSDSFREWLSGRRPSKTVGITATKSGSSSNGASGPVQGAPTGVNASITQPTSGGTDKTVTVVSESDAASARDKLTVADANTIKAELKKQFGNDVIAVNESFEIIPGTPSVVPAVGQEAASGKVSLETTYMMIGISRSDIRAVLEKDLQRQLGGLPNQSIYDQGLGTVKFSGYSRADSGYQVTIQTTGYIGPSIDSAQLAKKISGKREGEIQQMIKTYEGIRNVEVKFSPFWVSTAPAPEKITIRFQIDNGKN